MPTPISALYNRAPESWLFPWEPDIIFSSDNRPRSMYFHNAGELRNFLRGWGRDNGYPNIDDIFPLENDVTRKKEKEVVKLGGKSLIAQAVRKTFRTVGKSGNFWILPDQLIGVEVEVEGHTKTVYNPNADMRWSYWTTHNDGSLRGPSAEYVLNEPRYGKELETALDFICEVGLSNKWEISHRTAIHVHLNMTEDTTTLAVLRNLIKLYVVLETCFYGYAGEWRRWSGFCNAFFDGEGTYSTWKLLSTTDDPAVFANSIKMTNRYTGLNVAALGKYGSVEFRHLPTTFDAEDLKTWVNLIMCLKKKAVELAELPDEGAEFFSSIKDKGPEQWAKEVFSRSDVWGAIKEHIDVNAIRKWAVVARLFNNKVASGEELLPPRDASNYWTKLGEKVAENPILKRFLEVRKLSPGAAKIPKVKVQAEAQPAPWEAVRSTRNPFDDMLTRNLPRLRTSTRQVPIPPPASPGAEWIVTTTPSSLDFPDTVRAVFDDEGNEP